jgi:hypothetical protein
MMRTSVVLLALLAACSSSPDRSAPASQPPAASVPKRPGTDTLCMNDCLGSGARKELCDVRCNY